MAFCVICGNKLKENERFCNQCGADAQAMKKAFDKKNVSKASTEDYKSTPKKSVADQVHSNTEMYSGYKLHNNNDSYISNNSNHNHELNTDNKSQRNNKSQSSANTQNNSKKKNKTDSVKKRKIIIISVAAAVVLAAGIGIFLAWGNIMNLFGKYDEDHPGKIYCHITDEEHTAILVPGVYYADNEILVVSELGVSESKMKKLAKKYNAKIVGKIQQTGDYQWQFDEVYTEEELEDLANNIRTEDIVSRVDINYITETSTTGVDEINPGSQWTDTNDHSVSDLTDKAWGIKAIQADMAWGFCNTIKDEINPVRVGAIDVSFDTNHEDLKNCCVDYYDFGGSNDINKQFGHGTHVSGTFVADGMNDIGICGVYPYAQGKYYCSIGVGGEFRSSSIIQRKCYYAELILRNNRVINRSMGTTDAEYKFNQFDFFEKHYKDIGISKDEAISKDNEYKKQLYKSLVLEKDALVLFFRKCIDLGYDFLIVQAAGNGSNRNDYVATERPVYYYSKSLNSFVDKAGDDVITYEVHYSTEWTNAVINSPEIYIGYNGQDLDVMDRIIVVGSIGEEYKISDFSCIGKEVDIYAPGENIFSTVPNNSYANKRNFENTWYGTSMAAPHVAGTAALLYSINNNLTGPMVKSIIIESADIHSGYMGKHNYQFADYRVLDTFNSVKFAYENKAENNEILKNDVKKGAIFGWVLSKNTDSPISGAKVTITGPETYTAETDENGHFEVYGVEGDYRLNVDVNGYDYLFKDNVEQKVHIHAQGINYMEWIYIDDGTTTEITSLEDIDYQSPTVVDTTDDTVTDIPVDDIDDYMGDLSVDILNDFLPFLPGYDDNSGVQEALSGTGMFNTMHQALGFCAKSIEQENATTKFNLGMGYDTTCYAYKLEDINKCVRYFSEERYEESTFHDGIPNVEKEELDHDELLFSYNGLIYCKMWEAGPPGVDIEKAELYSDCIKIYYYWGGPGPADAYWVATFNKRDDGSYILSETKYLGNGSDSDDTDDTPVSGDWKQAYIDFLKGFADTGEDSRVENAAYQLENGLTVGITLDGKYTMNYGIDLVYIDDDEIPELILKDDWYTIIATYHNGSVQVSSVFTKYVDFLYAEKVGVYEEGAGTGDHYYIISKLIDGKLTTYCKGRVDATDVNNIYYYFAYADDENYSDEYFDDRSNSISEDEYNKLWNGVMGEATYQGSDGKMSIEEAVQAIEDY